MGTLTITASGFSALGAIPPANWPTGIVTFPASGNPNGTKTYTINDADWLTLLTWVAASQYDPRATGQPAPATPSAPQILLAWVASWISGAKTAIQQFNTTPGVPPTISIQ